MIVSNSKATYALFDEAKELHAKYCALMSPFMVGDTVIFCRNGRDVGSYLIRDMHYRGIRAEPSYCVSKLNKNGLPSVRTMTIHCWPGESLRKK
ncbi:MAG: hypothetical protein [Podoviridae sp. ctQNx1]|nr:MAG: hypothetical protein [Podoviridae sp. ctQNx1]UOF78153.1 hypothetical protein [Caudoviricetes sp.]